MGFVVVVVGCFFFLLVVSVGYVFFLFVFFVLVVGIMVL